VEAANEEDKMEWREEGGREVLLFFLQKVGKAREREDASSS
jgi:hypothetical protein